MAKRFDDVAMEWDSNPRRVRLAAAIGDAMLSALVLEPDFAVLDIGAGTGLVSYRILPYVGSVTAVDTSQEMLNQLARKKKKAGVENIETRYWDLEQAPIDQTFDAVISAMTFHHIHDIQHVLQHCFESLRPGGQIAIADLDEEDGSFHEEPEGVFHLGFAHDRFQDYLQKAGFEEIRFTNAHTVEKDTAKGKREFPVFLACARKPDPALQR
jgi:ubiquinone/menaquinone biosynthesis C-methylase UbiE